ncbi:MULTISPECIES: transglycosylase family protein [Mammaliicoccus]|uniref:transglycosylase family protein n=1 Tax=Mammaliicoccus TaxID=2803850 RepID=UPI001EFAC031|nr:MULTISPECIES: transglycosylase family protein [Mammaliicoccus]WHI55059.1 transglycosylase family protein [Mammaliicoccus lentus]WHI57581.1 transglycosylase family protein [Mammaliicoccus lentus]WHI65429.1 transglycosylase family protein [Mammaliicoccus lentus]WHI86320.1 transglycosylase family protein [Mammaliicoccus lentus]WHI90831.1 transglycosylase family protein [Mammaliicoccus lentus]
MKKAILSSTLAVAIGATGVASTNVADASEQNVNKEELAQLAQANAPQLNQEAIQEGAYDINFTLDGFEYNFESDGHNFTWGYHATNAADTEAQAPEATQEPVAEQPAAEQTQAPAEETQAPAATEQESNNVEAPQVEAPKQEAQQTQETKTTQTSSASEGSNVEVNDHLKAIAERESGGDLKAVNPSSGAAGKYQFLQSTWDSVAPAEYKGVSPTEAPESVQDAAAVKLYNEVGASQWVTA